MSGDDPIRSTALCQSLQRFDTPTVSNAIEALEVRDRTDGYASAEIRCHFPELGPLVGYAVTCTVDSTTGGAQRASRLGDLFDLLVMAPKPAAIVCQYVGSDRVRGCFIGDLSAALYRRLGAIGVVTDAPNRDLLTIPTRAPGFHVFGAGVVPSHGNGAVIDVNVPVVVGGLRVRPGDLIHADAHGVISVPLDVATEVVEQAERVLAQEREIFDLVEDPSATLEEIKRRFTH